MIRMGLAVFYNLALALIAIYAVTRGRLPERLGAAVNVIASAGSYLALPSVVTLRWQAIDPINLSIDMLVALAFFELSRRSDRFWPVWAFGFSLANLLVHVARATVSEQVALAYANASAVWAYLALIVLAIGIRSEANSPPPGPRLADRLRDGVRDYLHKL